MQEPFNLSFEQIADLTDRQILRILFRKRPGDKGRDDEDDGQSYREVYEQVWASRGLTPLQIEERYRQEFPEG